jgi:hypothetical protein
MPGDGECAAERDVNGLVSTFDRIVGAAACLAETGVLVNPGSPFGPSGDRFIRLSYATDEGRLREGLDRMAACGFAPQETISASATPLSKTPTAV